MYTNNTQISITKAEILHSAANRILHSRFYKLFYGGLALASLVCVILSIYERCPSGMFLVLEILVNLAMIIEVSIRSFALQKLFWKSLWNKFDILLVWLCLITLGFLFFGECSSSKSREAILDTALLVLRNVLQFVRLFIFMKK